MKSLSDLETQVASILNTNWARRVGQVVPETEDIRLGNDAVELDATVLYADLEDSTGLVLGYKDWFAAEVYKCYLLCACELIRNNGGSITAFDGDRVMGIFIGDTKNSSAAICALQVNYVVANVINAKLKQKYPDSTYQVKQAVGIDTSKLFVARTGIRGANDLVWVGRAANYAAKLCSLRTEALSSFITEDVFSRLRDDAKYGGQQRECMWQKLMWEERGIAVYASSWWWKPA
jgi:class 3 adenylate cyclase